MRISYSSHGNDLFASFNCTCPNVKYANNKLLAGLFNTEISLHGYNDAYFFNTVNEHPQETKCDCGKSWMVQWVEDGVDVNPKLPDDDMNSHFISAGWSKEGIRVDKEDTDQPATMQLEADDILIDGYELHVNENLWYVLYKNDTDTVIEKRWYRNLVGQSSRIIFCGSISSADDLTFIMRLTHIL